MAMLGGAKTVEDPDSIKRRFYSSSGELIAWECEKDRESYIAVSSRAESFKRACPAGYSHNARMWLARGLIMGCGKNKDDPDQPRKTPNGMNVRCFFIPMKDLGD